MTTSSARPAPLLGLTAANMTPPTCTQPRRDAITAGERDALLLARQACSARDRAIITVLLSAGPRRAELVALNISDVRLASHAGVLVVHGPDGEHEVALDRVARVALGAWMTVASGHGAHTPALFVSRRGRRISPRALDTAISNSATRAGVGPFARLRHDRVPRAMENVVSDVDGLSGCPLADVAFEIVAKKYREIRSALSAAGWEVVRQRGSHEVWAKPGENARIVVAGKDSDTVPVGTLSSIRRASGLEHLR